MKRPLAVTILGWLFLFAGAAGVVYHASERPLDRWFVVILSIRVIAIVGGVFLLKGRNWARWLVLGWVGFHVGVSAFHSVGEAIAHLVLILVVGYLLLTPPGSKYFEAGSPG